MEKQDTSSEPGFDPVVLSPQDAKRLAAMLETPPEPNAALRAAMARFRAMQKPTSGEEGKA